MVDLSKIHYPADIKGILMDELTELSGELLRTLLKKPAAHGRHVGPKSQFSGLFIQKMNIVR